MKDPAYNKLVLLPKKCLVPDYDFTGMNCTIKPVKLKKRYGTTIFRLSQMEEVPEESQILKDLRPKKVFNVKKLVPKEE